MIKSEWEWVEDKNGFTRFWVEDEDCVWVCSYCEEEGDVEEGCKNEGCSEYVEDDE